MAEGPAEVTLEVNPSTLERARLPAFREAGVTRLSIGIQSFDDTVLRRLGRAHRAEEGRRTLAAARDAGFDNLSLDLLFAAPGQDEAGAGPRSRGDRRLRAGARLHLRPHPRARHALRARRGAGTAAGARRGGGGAHDGAGGGVPRGGGPPALRDLELRPARLRIAPQPALLGAAAGAGARRRSLVVRAAGAPERPTAPAAPTSGSSRPGWRGSSAGQDRSPRARSSTRRPRGARPPSWRCGPAPGCVQGPLRPISGRRRGFSGPRRSIGSCRGAFWSKRMTGICGSPRGAVCSRIRFSPASSEVARPRRTPAG